MLLSAIDASLKSVSVEIPDIVRPEPTIDSTVIFGVTNPLLSPINSGKIGGGGGGGGDSSSRGVGSGSFGGGNGGPYPASTGGHATTNTGGGGGGSGGQAGIGGNGAPGLVAVVYPTDVSFTKTSGNLANNSPAPAPSSRTITIFTSGTGTITFA